MTKPFETPAVLQSFSSRKEWLDARRAVLGASDIATLTCPMDSRPSYLPSPAEIWAVKKGILAPAPSTEAARRGLILEPAVLSRYAEERGAELWAQPNSFFLNRELGLAASLDAFNLTEDLPVNAKTTAFRSNQWGAAGTDSVPDFYIIQACAEMLVVGRTVHHLPTWFLADDEQETFVVKLDSGIVKKIMDFAAAFTESLKEDEMPSWILDASESCGKALMACYPKTNETILEATGEAAILIEEIAKRKDLLKEAESRMEAMKNKLNRLCGHAAGIRHSGLGITWKRLSYQQERLDTTAIRTAHPELAAEFTKLTEVTSFRSYGGRKA